MSDSEAAVVDRPETGDLFDPSEYDAAKTNEPAANEPAEPEEENQKTRGGKREQRKKAATEPLPGTGLSLNRQGSLRLLSRHSWDGQVPRLSDTQDVFSVVGGFERAVITVMYGLDGSDPLDVPDIVTRLATTTAKVEAAIETAGVQLRAAAKILASERSMTDAKPTE